jgi:hypothetical protein
MAARNVVEIRLAARPQTVQVTLAGVVYTLQLYWNVFTDCWVIDIGDRSGNPLIRGIPLITGANLLAQFSYIGIPGQLLVISDQKPPDAVPGFTDLSVTGHLYYVT